MQVYQTGLIMMWEFLNIFMENLSHIYKYYLFNLLLKIENTMYAPQVTVIAEKIHWYKTAGGNFISVGIVTSHLPWNKSATTSLAYFTKLFFSDIFKYSDKHI
jgi:hypothetical protein